MNVEARKESGEVQVGLLGVNTMTSTELKSKEDMSLHFLLKAKERKTVRFLKWKTVQL